MLTMAAFSVVYCDRSFVVWFSLMFVLLIGGTRTRRETTKWMIVAVLSRRTDDSAISIEIFFEKVVEAIGGKLRTNWP